MSLIQRVRAHPWLAGGAAVVVLAGAGLGTYVGTHNDPAAASTPTRTETVSTGTIRQTVSATGTLAPAYEENLNFQVSGQVTSVAVSVGQPVKKGQALARVDSASSKASVAQAQATVASDQAKVDDDAGNGASDTQIAADQAALAAAENQLASAKSQLADATLISPIDGVVAEVNLTAGQSVSAGSSNTTSGNGNSSGNGSSSSGANNGGNNSTGSNTGNTSSSPQILVIGTNSWIVNATLDASSVGLIKTGNQAQLIVTGASSTVYGTVSSIGLVASSSSGIASYPVVIGVTGSPSGLHDGADVNVSIIYKQLSNVVVIPVTALHRNSSGGTYVEQVKNGKRVQTAVQIGLTSGGQVEIVAGLTEGNQILVPQPSTTGRGGTGRSGTIGGTGGQFPGGGRFPGGQFPGGGQFPRGGGFGG